MRAIVWQRRFIPEIWLRKGLAELNPVPGFRHGCERGRYFSGSNDFFVARYLAIDDYCRNQAVSGNRHHRGAAISAESFSGGGLPAAWQWPKAVMPILVGLLLIIFLAPVLGAADLPEIRSSRGYRFAFDHATVLRVEQLTLEVPGTAAAAMSEDSSAAAWGGSGGAIFGNIAGAAEAAKVKKTPGLKLQLELDSGMTVDVILQRNQKNAGFQVGDRVRFQHDSDGTTWVWQ